MAEFDITFKHLVEHHPEDFVRLLFTEPDGPVAVVNADVSTVAAEADKVIRVDGEPPWILHLEAQSSHDPRLPQRLHPYNVLLFEGVVNMTESTVYQSILERGVRESIITVGEERLGQVDASTLQMLESIHDIEQLKSLLKRVLSAKDWNDLLNGSTD